MVKKYIGSEYALICIYYFYFSTAKTVVPHLESASTKEGNVTPASPFPDSPPVPPPRSRHTSASQDSDGSRHSSAERHSLKGMDFSCNI